MQEINCPNCGQVFRAEESGSSAQGTFFGFPGTFSRFLRHISYPNYIQEGAL
ncbi:MAG: hypothetical protein IKD96_07950 [Oscillospiraceae bacterium]|nr:hypothetical protein [Oscillospiraceae bacterium]